MYSYRKYIRYLVILITIISLSANLFFAIQLRVLGKKVSNSNVVISTRVESAIRDTIHSIKGIKETGAKEEMIDLQRSVQQLALIFNSWVDLNQTEEKPNDALMLGLHGLETLKSTVVHNLNNQYSSHNEKLTDYDIVLLDKVYEQLERFSAVYNNIQGRVQEIKDPDNGDGGLGQWASNIEEVSRLYRHSRIPNEHPTYMPVDSILTRVDKILPELVNFTGSKVVTEDVQIRDGVHYYEISYYAEDDLVYSIWIDAINGFLRQFEDYTTASKDTLVSEDQALNIAKKFMNRFESYEQMIDGVSAVKDENTQDTIYAFQFIPILDDVTMISDTVKVNVSSRGGKVIKYSNNFNGTIVPISEVVVSLEDIEQKHSEQLLDMKYSGMAIVRSFYTHYRPVVTYSYQSTKKEDIRKLYFDIATGNQVYESYSVYEPVSYIPTEENYQ